MKQLLTTILFSFSTFIAFSQKVDRNRLCSYCKCDTNKCGPWDMLDKIQPVTASNTIKTPFPFIIHVETTRNYLIKSKIDYGTVSFISSNILLTARHVVSGPVNKIKLSKSTSGQDNWIEFSKREFSIVEYAKGIDVALIRINNLSKLSSLYSGNFEIAEVDSSVFSKSDTISLTGYSCYFADDPSKHDTLINKQTIINELNTEKASFLGYHLFTCIGDSGAPLWIEKNGRYYVVGVHHGGGEDAGLNGYFNISTKINAEIIKWLRRKIAE